VGNEELVAHGNRWGFACYMLWSDVLAAYRRIVGTVELPGAGERGTADSRRIAGAKRVGLGR
jgi:hypothetical protein